MRRPVLGPDGVGTVEVGSPQAAAVATLARNLGTPQATVPGDCKGTTEVEWGDLSLEFSEGTLTGYRYLLGGLGSVGTEEQPVGRISPSLATGTGATLGMTLAEARHLYPARDLTSEHDGAIAVPGRRDHDRLLLVFSSMDPRTPLHEIKGGTPCGDF